MERVGWEEIGRRKVGGSGSLLSRLPNLVSAPLAFCGKLNRGAKPPTEDSGGFGRRVDEEMAGRDRLHVSGVEVDSLER